MNIENKKIGFVITEKTNMLPKTIKMLKELSKIKNIHIIPIIDFETYNWDLKINKEENLIPKIEEITKTKVIYKIINKEVEKLEKIDILIIFPCSGNTISKFVLDIVDNSVTTLTQLQLRNNKPVVIGILSNNGLARDIENIGKLLKRKNYYFVPFKQANPITNPNLIVCDWTYIEKTISYALEGKQIQPIISSI